VPRSAAVRGARAGRFDAAFDGAPPGGTEMRVERRDPAASRQGFWFAIAVVLAATALGWFAATSRGGLPAPHHAPAAADR
jgi:hypothetical protein